MRIAVDMGHCPKSSGAVGFLDELTEDRKLGKALIAELKARGHEVVNVTPPDSAEESLTGRARRANEAKADFFVSVHFNAGGGTGVEVFTTNNSGAKDEAKRASAAIAEVLGLRNRGHKTANFTVIAKTVMPAMLVEVCFVDTLKDAVTYRKNGAEKVAAAIAYGIVGGSKAPIAGNPNTGKGDNKTAPENGAHAFKAYKVKITASVLNVRKGAGTNYGVATTVKKGEVYTIVGEKMNGSTKWGKLKSGAGWISLAYAKKL